MFQAMGKKVSGLKGTGLNCCREYVEEVVFASSCFSLVTQITDVDKLLASMVQEIRLVH